MIRSLFIARTGLDAQQTRMDVTANNLANVNTTGFKKSQPTFEDLTYQTIRQPGASSSQQTQIPTGLQVGTGTRLVSTEKNFTQGSLQKTDNSLDIAIQGNGFLQVQMPDGTVAYTRDGSLKKDNQGQLVTSDGYLITPPITVPANASTISIGNDGVVSVTQPGSPAATQIGQIQLASFVNNGGLLSIGKNLYQETASSGQPNTGAPNTNEFGSVLQGYIESSNVNVAEELINMIQTQRAYELNSKVISTSDQMLAKLSQL